MSANGSKRVTSSENTYAGINQIPIKTPNTFKPSLGKPLRVEKVPISSSLTLASPPINAEEFIHNSSAKQQPLPLRGESSQKLNIASVFAASTIADVRPRIIQTRPPPPPMPPNINANARNRTEPRPATAHSASSSSLSSAVPAAFAESEVQPSAQHQKEARPLTFMERKLRRLEEETLRSFAAATQNPAQLHDCGGGSGGGPPPATETPSETTLADVLNSTLVERATDATFQRSGYIPHPHSNSEPSSSSSSSSTAASTMLPLSYELSQQRLHDIASRGPAAPSSGRSAFASVVRDEHNGSVYRVQLNTPFATEISGPRSAMSEGPMELRGSKGKTRTYHELSAGNPFARV